MWKNWVPPALLAAAVAAVWAWPVSRNFFLGRLENNIGVLYAAGVLVNRDEVEAARWYKKAAELDAASGEFNYAFALQQGVGAAVNESEAAHWYERAAAHGMAEAANNLGLMYANPSSGPPDLVRARIWLKRALPLAEHSLAVTIRDNLQVMEKDMSPAELAASDDPSARTATASAVPERTPAPIAADERTPPAQKVAAAIDSALPLRDAVTRYVAIHRRAPSPRDAGAVPSLRPVDTPQGHVELGNGGAIEITLRGGKLNGETLSLIPILDGGVVNKWICAKGRVPLHYVGHACG